jgi:hypothetical protein
MEVAPNQQASIQFSMGRGMRIMHKRIISAVKRVEFVNDRLSSLY